jgi:exportin-5
MDSHVNELLHAWRICKDGSVRDPKVHESAFNYIEQFKQTSPHLLDTGFLLAYQKDSFEVTYFGLQLITHTIKFRWNDFPDALKTEVKQRLMGIIVNLDNNHNAKGPYYVKNCMCLVIIELIKREWPQHWPALITDLFDIAAKSAEHKKLIFVIFKYMAEEFIDTDSTVSAQLPPQRRKDINQHLNQNMESILLFYLDTLESCLASPAALTDPVNTEMSDLANSCLDSLSNYINWIQIGFIAARNYSMVNILLALLDNQRVCKNAAKCLAGLANRKGGDACERKPLLGLFNERVLCQLVNAIKACVAEPSFKDLVKYLVEILTGMGGQLNYLWNTAEFAGKDKPACLPLYLEAICQLLFLENRLHSLEAIQTLNMMLQNEFIQTDSGMFYLIFHIL